MMLFQDIPDGVKLRGRDFTKITEAHNADRVISVQGASTFPGSNGTALVIPRPKIRNIYFSHPFKISNASTEEPKVTVQLGMLNNLIPKIGANGLTTVPAPTLSTPATGYILLKVTTTSGIAFAAAIEHQTEIPEDSSTVGYIVLGLIVVTSAEITTIEQSVYSSLQHLKCGTETHLWGSV